MLPENERRRAHLEECLTQLGRVCSLVRDAVKNDKSFAGVWTDVKGLRELAAAVETVSQLVALLPPEEGALARLAPLSDGLHALERLLLAHSQNPYYRPLGPGSPLVRDAVRSIQRGCGDLEPFLQDRLGANPS